MKPNQIKPVWFDNYKIFLEKVIREIIKKDLQRRVFLDILWFFFKQIYYDL
jgi:hypothetical protein